MPLPEWKKKVPGKQSLAARLRATILNHDLVRPFGPPGTTSGASHTESATGGKPRTDQWNDNAMVEKESNVSATRPRRERGRSDLAR